MGVFGFAIVLCWFGRNLRAVITQRGFGLLLFVGIDHIVNHVGRQNLAVFKHYILMLEDLRVFLLVVQIYRLESLRALDRIRPEFMARVAVALADRYFVHDTAHLFLGVPYLAESDRENHAVFRKFIAFLANLDELVIFGELFHAHEGLEDDATVGIAAERRAEMCVFNISDFLYCG